MFAFLVSKQRQQQRRNLFLKIANIQYPSLFNTQPSLVRIAFADILEHEFITRYRVIKAQIEEMVVLLEIPSPIVLENGDKIEHKLACCILLEKLAHPITN